MSEQTFTKMHGLGNDFVVMDLRDGTAVPSSAQIIAVSDRRTGVGCDQFITMEPAKDSTANAFMGIYNCDGGEVEACGNATRCVARLLLDEANQDQVVIETVVGKLYARRTENGDVAVNMGRPGLTWQSIPLAAETDTLHIPVTSSDGSLSDGVAVNMGNPHVVYFVDDVDAVPLEQIGRAIEHDPLFPDRINVEVVQVLSPTQLRMRVWERGVGITMACGTGACATLVAAHRRGLAERAAEVILDGGPLQISWDQDSDAVWMTGPAAIAYTGQLNPAVLKDHD